MSCFTMQCHATPLFLMGYTFLNAKLMGKFTLFGLIYNFVTREYCSMIDLTGDSDSDFEDLQLAIEASLADHSIET